MASSDPSNSVRVGADAFRAELVQILERAQASLRGVVDQIPGKLGNAADLRRALDLDTRLSTQLFRMLREPEVLRVAADVPGGPSLRRFVLAAAERGATAGSIAAFEREMSAFERFVVERAGDRVRFESIAVNLGARGEEAIELSHRRAAHRAMSHLLGMQLRQYVRTSIIVRSAGVGIDFAQIRGFDGVERLRPGASIPLFASRLLGVPGVQVPENLHQRLEFGDPVGSTAARLISRSGGGDQVRVVEQLGAPQVELDGDDLGAARASTLYFAEVDANVPVHLVPAEETVGINHAIGVPAERLVMNLWVERGLLQSKVTANVYLNRAGRSAAVYRPEDRLHAPPPLTAMRDVAWALRGIEVEHARAISTLLSALAWSDRVFECFRIELEYPVVGTFMRLGGRVLV